MRGIEVTTGVMVEWSELGVEFADLISTEQAAFFLSLGESVNHVQLAYIGSEIAREIAEDPAGYESAKQGLVMFALHILDSLETK